MERSYLDFARWHSHLNNKQYYEKNPSNANEFRTMMVRFDMVAGRPRLVYETNWVNGAPPPNIPEISPLLKSRIMNGNWGNSMF